MKKIERWERQLEAVYASLPHLDCKGLCSDSCGPIGVFRREGQRLREATGRPLAFKENMRCTFLGKDQQCQVYAVRPIICRLYGMVEHAMRCKHGCEPSRWLSAKEGHAIMQKVHEIAGEAQFPRPDASVDPKIAAYVHKVSRESARKMRGIV